MNKEELQKLLDERKESLKKAEENLDRAQKMMAAIANGVLMLRGRVEELENILKNAKD